MYQTIISAKDLAAALQSEPKKWVIFDCRFNLADTAAGAQAFAAGHISGAQFLDLDKDLSSPITPTSGRHPLPDMETLAQRFADAGVSAETQIVVYDDCGGAMAARTWWLLRWCGHTAVAVLDGGIAAWEVSGQELTQEQVAPQSTTFEYQLDSNHVLSAEQLQTALEKASVQLVDARAAERYRGEVEPIDPIAGHVPGALNRPLTDNLEQGRFKSAELLRKEWLALLDLSENKDHDQDNAQIVHMCGSGVTACHNMLSMEIAGLKGSRIYAGSWSEWIRDPARPVETG